MFFQPEIGQTGETVGPAAAGKWPKSGQRLAPVQAATRAAAAGAGFRIGEFRTDRAPATSATVGAAVGGKADGGGNEEEDAAGHKAAGASAALAGVEASQSHIVVWVAVGWRCE